MVRFAYLVVVRSSFVSIWSMFVSVVYFMNCISLGVESGLSVRYNLYYVVCFDIIFVEGSGF